MTMDEEDRTVQNLYKQNKVQQRRIKELEELQAERDKLLKTVQLVYRKHCMGYDGIGWDELGGVLLDALCNTMSSEGYEKWKQALKGGAE